MGEEKSWLDIKKCVLRRRGITVTVAQGRELLLHNSPPSHFQPLYTGFAITCTNEVVVVVGKSVRSHLTATWKDILSDILICLGEPLSVGFVP